MLWTSGSPLSLPMHGQDQSSAVGPPNWRKGASRLRPAPARGWPRPAFSRASEPLRVSVVVFMASSPSGMVLILGDSSPTAATAAVRRSRRRDTAAREGRRRRSPAGPGASLAYGSAPGPPLPLPPEPCFSNNDISCASISPFMFTDLWVKIVSRQLGREGSATWAGRSWATLVSTRCRQCVVLWG